jgi:hypothetical protein
MKEALISSETSVLTRATRRNIPEYAILHSHRREKLKYYVLWTISLPADYLPLKKAHEEIFWNPILKALCWYEPH